MNQYRRSSAARRPLTLVLLVVFLVSGHPVMMRVPSASASSDEDQDRAQRLYNMRKYGEALALVEKLVAIEDIEGIPLRDARILQGRCLVQLDRTTEARQAFENVLDIDRNWQPDSAFLTYEEIEVFQFAQAEYKPPKPWWKKPLAWVGGG
ncbi:MAG: hypothetical protein ABIF77_08260 [bacterium]